MSGLNQLVSEGILPVDSQVLTEHNNTIVVSESEQIVARIAMQAAMQEREDPGDLIYSHRLSWNLGATAGVVTPLEAEPKVYNGFVLSIYPLMQPIKWAHVSAEQMSRTVRLFNEASVANPQLRTMDIGSYAQQRINQVECEEGGQSAELVDVQNALDAYQGSYPFHELTTNSPSLVHGDLHTGNVVTDKDNKPLLIDLDSAAIGPTNYDIASWHVRHFRGDTAPTAEMLENFRLHPGWSEESFRALMGWKVISSLTHTLRYERKSDRRRVINHLFWIAANVGAAGDWKESHVTA